MSGKDINVLLVEDSLADARLVETAFRRENHIGKFIHVKTAEQGLEKLEGASDPHLVLLDLNLPGMNGHDFLRVAKSRPDLRKHVIVILSTSRSESDIARAKEYYVNAYFQKPGEFEEILTVVRTALNFWGQEVSFSELGSSGS